MTTNNTENERRFNLARFWWMPVIGVPVTIALMLAVRNFVRDVLAMPVSLILWFFKLVLDSIPQSICWFTLLVMVIVFAIKSLGTSRGPSTGKPQPPAPRPGRVAMWADRIDLLLKGNYSRHRFGYYIGRLILDVLSHEEQVSYRDIEIQLEQETLTLPPVVEEYLMSRLKPALATRTTLFERVKQFLGLERHPTSPLNREIESVVHYLETESGGGDRRGVREHGSSAAKDS